MLSEALPERITSKINHANELLVFIHSEQPIQLFENLQNSDAV